MQRGSSMKMAGLTRIRRIINPSVGSGMYVKFSSVPSSTFLWVSGFYGRHFREACWLRKGVLLSYNPHCRIQRKDSKAAPLFHHRTLHYTTRKLCYRFGFSYRQATGEGVIYGVKSTYVDFVQGGHVGITRHALGVGFEVDGSLVFYCCPSALVVRTATLLFGACYG
jgi:hypothetical protein